MLKIAGQTRNDRCGLANPYVKHKTNFYYSKLKLTSAKTP